MTGRRLPIQGGATSKARARLLRLAVPAGALLFAGAVAFGAPARSLAQAVTINADASKTGPRMAGTQLGVNLLANIPQSGDPSYVPLLASAGVGLFRWPGGGTSDFYHWKTHSYSICSSLHQYPPVAATAFDAWMQTIAKPLRAQVAITVNYGTSADCKGLGDPQEAAAWVDYANNVKHYGIKYWMIGNEQYFPLGGLLPGYNPDPYDPAAYAKAVAEKFYPLMKAKSPGIQIGINMAFGNAYNPTPWDSVVLKNAKYDFVEMHFYPNYNNMAQDVKDLTTNADLIAKNFASARALLAANGHPNTPIYFGEFDRDSGAGPGVAHEGLSIVDGLFNAIVVGETVKAGVQMATAWIGIDNCVDDPKTPSVTAYGWQHFGSFGLFAAGGSGFSLACPDKGAAQGTAFPKGRVYQILSHYVVAGEHSIKVTSSNPSVRAYGATNHGGYAFLLVNTNSAATATATMALADGAAASYKATSLRYGKREYDMSKAGVWMGVIGNALGTVTDNFNVSLAPWSVTLVKLAPTP